MTDFTNLFTFFWGLSPFSFSLELFKVLNSKMRRAHELKRKLGITAWSELTTDMGQGIKNVRESGA